METSTEHARFNMIQQQIRPWGVLDDRVLDVMGELLREAFVPDAYRGLAYADIEIPIGAESSMLAPKLVGRMLQALQVQPGDKALEIGTGTGYVAACLRNLGARVISVEIDPALAAEATARLTALKVKSVDVREADGLASAIPGGPYNVIAITGSMPTDDDLPRFQEQLAVGGRLCCFLGTEPVMQCVLVTRESKDAFRREALLETSVPPLRNVVEPETFEL
ncbi:protein-L-isoaspartate O-methyltransferase family protein [Thiorhodococcus minor]|uniref:Protein-L-isoaspartate O-methyltransferase n=1 Tax=Thiorhodococcus minor TaxID=57489 RepID=A0A6M0JSX5_9GAMM|nr:protein-L-isoaspartate O-methyltransferase [Thiorhodococcus minor]NEV60626.1 protein-L-isoaspartate O-methyltransferase [Thiorhodococcus minor]